MSLRTLLASAALLAVSACVPIRQDYVPRFSDETLAKIGKEAATRDQILSMLGEPDARSGERVFYYGWQQETVRESAQKIRDLGMELFDRLRVMAEHLDDVGRNLGRAVDAFNNAAGSFEHRVLVSARRFRELGAAGSKELPELEPVERSVREIAPPESEDRTEPASDS